MLMFQAFRHSKPSLWTLRMDWWLIAPALFFHYLISSILDLHFCKLTRYYSLDRVFDFSVWGRLGCGPGRSYHPWGVSPLQRHDVVGQLVDSGGCWLHATGSGHGVLSDHRATPQGVRWGLPETARSPGHRHQAEGRETQERFVLSSVTGFFMIAQVSLSDYCHECPHLSAYLFCVCVCV